MPEKVFGLVIVLLVLWAGYCKWKSSKEFKEPLYIKYKTDHFSKEHYRRIFDVSDIKCPICRKYHSYWGCINALCHDCWERVKNKEILKEQGISFEVMNFSANNGLLPILNLVQIDLQRSSITKSDAKCIMDEIAKEMIENTTYYKIAKKAAGGKRLVYNNVRVTFLGFGEDERCMICGHIQHRDCSSCEAKYEWELKAKKFPNKLKEILNRIAKEGEGYVKESYTYYDWRYLNLIAKDLDRGFIEKPEALSEAERYIDLIYNDIINVPEELAAKKNAPPKPVVKTESEKFMDDILS